MLAHDDVTAADLAVGVDDVVITSGSQQLLYLLGELLLDPGDIVITEAPSYFVYHGVLTSLGVRVLAVPMDEQGMLTDALEEMLVRLEQSGELERVRLIYTVDYYQNPSGRTLALGRRQHLLELARRFSKQQRLFILEDAAYRELRYDGPDLPSIKSFDDTNEHVILAMTFSKPAAPGLKTGYGILPRELAAPLVRFKGNHDFGSSNLNQHILDRLLGSGAYERHVHYLRDVYRHKRDVLLGALAAEFPVSTSEVRWTQPAGGLYVWLRCPRAGDGAGQPFHDSRPGARRAVCARRVLLCPGRRWPSAEPRSAAVLRDGGGGGIARGRASAGAGGPGRAAAIDMAARRRLSRHRRSRHPRDREARGRTRVVEEATPTEGLQRRLRRCVRPLRGRGWSAHPVVFVPPANFCDPFGVDTVIRWFRCAQPPANFCDPFGVNLTGGFAASTTG